MGRPIRTCHAATVHPTSASRILQPSFRNHIVSFHADMTIRDRAPHGCNMAFVIPVCMARQRRRGKRPSRRSNKGKITGPARVNPPNVPDADLVSQFTEDVSKPLVPGKTKNKEDDKRFRLPIDLPWKSFDVNKFQELTREDILNLLVRGAWIGIGVLVGYFFVVHFVIVRDLLPG